MQHNNSFRRILFVLVSLLYPFLAWPQVHIKERIEIRPKPPAIRTAPASTSEMPLFTEGQRTINRSQGLAVVVTRPAAVIATGTIEVSPGPGGDYPNTDLTIYYGGGVCANYRKYPGSDPNTYSAPVTRTIRCGYTGPDLWSALSALELENVDWDIGSSTATITFTGKLGGLYPYTATASLSASADNSYDLSTIAVTSNRTSVTRCDNTASVTIQLQDGAGRAFPSGNCGSQPDLMTISFSSTTATSPSLTIDWSEITSSGTTLEAADRSGQLTWNPVSPDEEGQVTLLVEASGKSGSTTITLSKEAPSPVLSLNYYEEIIFGMKSPINVAAQDCRRVGVSLSPGVTYQFSIMNGPGILRDPSTGAQARSLGFISNTQGKASVTYSSRDTLFAPSARIEVKTSDHSIVPVYADIQITPTDLVVTLDKNPVFFGDSTTLTVQLKNPDGTLSSIPSEWVTMYNFIDDDTLAFFSTPDGVSGGTFVWGNYPWVRVNTRPQATPPDSVELMIGVFSYNSGGGGGIPTSARPSELMTLKKGQKTPGVFFPQPDGESKKTIADARSDANSKVQPTLQEEGGGSPYHYGIATLVVKKKKEGLHHFKVTLEKDTIAFTETSKIFVQAKDANDADIELDTGRLLEFSLMTNEEYATFIDKMGDTIKTKPVRLHSVSYGDAKSGLIRFAAVKKNPNSAVVCKILVELGAETENKGDTTLVVVEQTLKIVMEQPYQVRPSIPTEDSDTARVSQRKKTFEVKVTRGGKPVAEHPFRLWTDVVDSTGGHDHDSTRTVRREGTDECYGFFQAARSPGRHRPFDTLTTPEGSFAAIYNASVFGDSMRIFVASTDPSKKAFLKDSKTIAEKVDSLELLNSGADYDLVGGTPGHHGPPGYADDNNHWATDSVIQRLRRIAENWHRDFPRESLLGINDISLPFGGKFDVNGRWTGPHGLHRLGKSADVRTDLWYYQFGELKHRVGIPIRSPRTEPFNTPNNQRNPNSTLTRNPRFEEICRGNHSTPRIHNDNTISEHYHTEFSN